jgi:isocitrate dehydrogenase (NAD+)
VVPGANLGARGAIFEAVHGTAPDIAGRNKANPTALLMSAILMLRHLGMPELAGRVEKALLATFEAGIRTPDLGGTAGTAEFAKAVAERAKV